MFFSALNIKIIWQLLSRRRRRQLFFLVILMVLGSFSEAASLGALLPFIWYLSGDINNLGGFLIIDEWAGGQFRSNQTFGIFIFVGGCVFMFWGLDKAVNG